MAGLKTAQILLTESLASPPRTRPSSSLPIVRIDRRRQNPCGERRRQDAGHGGVAARIRRLAATGHCRAATEAQATAASLPPATVAAPKVRRPKRLREA